MVETVERVDTTMYGDTEGMEKVTKMLSINHNANEEKIRKMLGRCI